ncbi:MAG: cobalamin B12-binding domain-containing protein [Armatimonadetes bacterium]|nr:cobalamin B12-binding domain-containing protein [Armatimonadota bacterium]
MPGTIVAGALGNCVHVAGVVRFLAAAEQFGYKTEFLGAAVSIDEFVEAIRKYDPEIVGISYRLTPDVGIRLLKELKGRLQEEGLADRRFAFGGLPPTCEAARELEWIERRFSGLENPDVVWSYLRGGKAASDAGSLGDTLLERLKNKRPYPLLRHHFGLPDMAGTVEGVRKIAEAGVLDVISVAPDQNAQESFFRSDEMDAAMDGAGGAPIRTAEDLKELYSATRTGNQPLLRIYSGTRDLIKWAELATETIDNAWAAIPLCWYSALDGRSKRPVAEAVAENQSAMRWYGERDIPVEVNEPHHWSLRDAHDTVSVATAYLSAYNAKQMGVKNYVAQYMFNSPPALYGAMDLAKILAQMEMVESLHGPDFVSYRQVRAGLLHLSPHLSVAKGQLAASTMLALSVLPHIIHVVGFCEGDHAASAEDVVESCQIVHGVLRNSLQGSPDMASDEKVLARKNELLAEAGLLLDAIHSLGDGEEDPLASPQVIARAIKLGIIDAPHLRGNPQAAGRLQTRILNGAVYAVDPVTKAKLSEAERLETVPKPGGPPAKLTGSFSCHSRGYSDTRYM